jgi:hypothetical protein
VRRRSEAIVIGAKFAQVGRNEGHGRTK